MSDLATMPRKLMLTISALQGLALFLLYRAFDQGLWPSESPLWAFPLWTLAVATPVLLLLSLAVANKRKVIIYVSGFSAVLAVLGMYVGWQAEPFGEFPVFNMAAIYALTTALACFKALMYIQQRAAGKSMSYDILFAYSWRNFLTLTLACLFVFVFWLILLLWAHLFDSIGVSLFRDLFFEQWFLFPVLSVAGGIGVIVFRNLERIIDSITRLLQGLIKLLLPLVVAVAILFLVSLPFVGLDALWSTGRGTALLLWLLAVTLFFTNAVYQDGRGDSPYSLAIHRAIYAGLAVLPVVSLLSLYGLWLRLAQYGWTVARAWAFLTWLVLSLFAFGYAIGIARKKDHWMTDLARVNTSMGIVVLVLMLLASSPLLDFRKLSVSSQLARVDSQEVTLEEFDYWYAYSTLARPGYLAVENIKQEIGDSNPELLRLIAARPRYQQAHELISADEFWQRVHFLPAEFVVPAELRSYVYETFATNDASVRPFMLRVNLNDDPADEFVLIRTHNGYVYNANIYVQTEDGWRFKTASTHTMSGYSGNHADSLDGAEISVEEPQFKELRIGDIVIRANPQDPP